MHVHFDVKDTRSAHCQRHRSRNLEPMASTLTPFGDADDFWDFVKSAKSSWKSYLPCDLWTRKPLPWSKNIVNLPGIPLCVRLKWFRHSMIFQKDLELWTKLSKFDASWIGSPGVAGLPHNMFLLYTCAMYIYIIPHSNSSRKSGGLTLV